MSCESELLVRDFRPLSRSHNPSSIIGNRESSDSAQTSHALAQSIEDVRVIQRMESSSFDVLFEFRNNLRSQQVALSSLSFQGIQPTTDLEFNGSNTRGQEDIPYSSRSTWGFGSFSEAYFLSVYCNSSSVCDKMTLHLQKKNKESDTLEEEAFVLYSHHAVNIRRGLISRNNETLESIYALMDLGSQGRMESFLIPPGYARSKFQLLEEEGESLISLDLKLQQIESSSLSVCYETNVFSIGKALNCYNELSFLEFDQDNLASLNNLTSLNNWSPPNEIEPFYVRYPASSDEQPTLRFSFQGHLRFKIFVPYPSDALSSLSEFTVTVEPGDAGVFSLSSAGDSIIEDSDRDEESEEDPSNHSTDSDLNPSVDEETIVSTDAGSDLSSALDGGGEELQSETCEEVRYTVRSGDSLDSIANRIYEGNFESFGELSENQKNLLRYLKSKYEDIEDSTKIIYNIWNNDLGVQASDGKDVEDKSKIQPSYIVTVSCPEEIAITVSAPPVLSSATTTGENTRHIETTSAVETEEYTNYFFIFNEDGKWFSDYTPYRKKLDILVMISPFSDDDQLERLAKALEQLINDLQKRGVDWQLATVNSSYYYNEEHEDFTDFIRLHFFTSYTQRNRYIYILHPEFLLKQPLFRTGNLDQNKSPTYQVFAIDEDIYKTFVGLAAPLSYQLKAVNSHCKNHRCENRPLYHLLRVLDQSKRDQSIQNYIHETQTFFRSDAELALILFSSTDEGYDNFTTRTDLVTGPIEIQKKILNFRKDELYDPKDESFQFNNNWKEKKLSVASVLFPSEESESLSCPNDITHSSAPLLRELMEKEEQMIESEASKTSNLIVQKAVEVNICREDSYYENVSENGLFSLVSHYPLLAESEKDGNGVFFEKFHPIPGQEERGLTITVTQDRFIQLKFVLSHFPKEGSLKITRHVFDTPIGESGPFESMEVPASDYSVSVETVESEERVTVIFSSIPSHQFPVGRIKYIIKYEYDSGSF